jgi:hypothetical protein
MTRTAALELVSVVLWGYAESCEGGLGHALSVQSRATLP